MKRISFFLFVSAFMLTMVSVSDLSAQNNVRSSLQATVIQNLDTNTVITVNYSRPGVKGRTIWGDLVPWGLTPGNKYSGGKPFPWRGGANENTTFETSTKIMVEGKSLDAGKYGLHFIPDQDEFIVIFSNVNDLWGSYKYDEANDAIRVIVKPEKNNHVEWLEYGFENLGGTSADLVLKWGKLKIPVKLSTR